MCFIDGLYNFWFWYWLLDACNPSICTIITTFVVKWLCIENVWRLNGKFLSCVCCWFSCISDFIDATHWINDSMHTLQFCFSILTAVSPGPSDVSRADFVQAGCSFWAALKTTTCYHVINDSWLITCRLYLGESRSVQAVCCLWETSRLHTVRGVLQVGQTSSYAASGAKGR